MLDAVTVLARAPERGAVKTRLARDVGDAAACALHEATALDVIESLSGSRCALVVALTGSAGAVRDFARSCERFAGRVEAQAPGDLGDRMSHALSRRLLEGASRSAVVGTDCLDALEALHACDLALVPGCDVALAPASDGGFVAIASSRPLRRGTLAGIAWGTAHALDETAAALVVRGVAVAVAPRSHDDVDDLAALRRLARRLRSGGPPAPRTRAVLARLGLGSA